LRLFAIVICGIATLPAQNVRWVKTAAPDGAFSLQQPEGWTAKYGGPTVSLRNTSRDEEIVVIRIPLDPSKPVPAYVEAVAQSFRKSLAAFEVSNLTSAQDSAAFLVTYTSANKRYSGPGAVTAKGNSVWWVSYGSPLDADMTRGATLITGVIGSVAYGGALPATSMQVPAGGQASTAGQPGSVIGNWSTSNVYGDIVNRSTGAFLMSNYNGEWYNFKADGSYRYTHAASGQFIAGVVITEGTYEARGETVLLHQKTESWYPFHNDPSHKPTFKDKPTPEETTLHLEFKGPAELRVWDKNPKLSTTFHRDPNSK
jgi:hypothetical protein